MPAIAQTTTTMDELLSASKQIASSADAVVQIAEKTLSAAQSGEEAVHESFARGVELAHEVDQDRGTQPAQEQLGDLVVDHFGQIGAPSGREDGKAARQKGC